jgi:hypothetical protein
LDLGSGRFSVQGVWPLTGSDNVVCKIYASQPGDSKFQAAVAVEQILLFKKQATRMNFRTSAPTATEGGTFIYASASTINGRIGGTGVTPTMTSLTPTVCIVEAVAVYDTVNGPRGTVRAKSNGTCSIKLDHPEQPDTLASTATWSSVVSGMNAPVVGSNAPQTLTFPAVVDRNYGFSAKLLATSTSKLPVKYISLTPEVCFIIEQLADGPSVQSSTSSGAERALCTVEATQPGDDRYAAAAPVKISFNYIKAPMRLLHASAPSRMIGAAPYTFVTNVRYVDNAMNSGLASLGHMLTVTSLTPAVCRVDSNVLWDRSGGIVNRTQVTGLSNGSCQLNFYFAGTTTRAPSTLVTIRTVSGFKV